MRCIVLTSIRGLRPFLAYTYWGANVKFLTVQTRLKNTQKALSKRASIGTAPLIKANALAEKVCWTRRAFRNGLRQCELSNVITICSIFSKSPNIKFANPQKRLQNNIFYLRERLVYLRWPLFFPWVYFLCRVIFPVCPEALPRLLPLRIPPL